MFETTARVLALALNGVHYSRIVAAAHARQDEIKWLLEILVEKKLLEYDSSLYWITVDGIKFLEIHLQMEHILQAKRSLV